MEAADSGLLTEPARHPVAYRSTALAPQLAAGPAGYAEFDFEPSKQTVRAQVEARFTMSAPSFGPG